LIAFLTKNSLGVIF